MPVSHVPRTKGPFPRGQWFGVTQTSPASHNLFPHAGLFSQSDHSQLPDGNSRYNNALVYDTTDAQYPGTGVYPDLGLLLSSQITDAVSRISTRAISESESLTTSDSSNRSTIGTRQVPDSLTISDTPTRSMGNSRSESESLTTSDSLTRSAGFLKGIQETDNDLYPATVVYPSQGTLLTGLLDLPSRQFVGARSSSDSLSLSDTPTRQIAVIRAISQALSISDAVTRAILVTRTVAQSLSPSDAVIRAFTGIRQIAQSLTTSESPARQTTVARAESESLTASDALTRQTAAYRTESETLTASDASTRLFHTIRQIADTGNISWPSPDLCPDPNRTPSFWQDEVARAAVVSRSESESLTTTDQATRQTTLGRALSQVLSTSDAVVRAVTNARTIVQSLSTSDAPTRAFSGIRQIAESLATSEVVTRLLVLVRSIADAVTGTDSGTRVISFPRLISDQAYSYVSYPSQTTYPDPTLDPSKWPDSAARQFVGARTDAESIVLSETPTRQTAIARSESESLSISDSLVRSITALRSSTDALTRTNLCTNPSFETDATQWDTGGGGSTLTRVTSWGAVGSASGELVGTATNNDVSAFWPKTSFPACTPGDKIACKGSLQIGTSNTASGTGPRIGVQFDDGSNSFNLTSTFSSGISWPAIGGTGKVSVVATAPANAVKFRTRWLGNTTGTQTVDILWDAILVEKATSVGTYFDGSGFDDNGTFVTDPSCAWTGTANLSSSTASNTTRTALVRVAGMARTIADTANIQWPSSWVYPDPNRDPSFWLDEVARATVVTRSESESLSTSAVPTRQTAIGRLVSDSLSTSDAITRVIAISRSIAETAHLYVPFPGPDTDPSSTLYPGTSPDVVVRSLVLFRTTADSLTTSDSLNRLVILARNLSESLTSIDAVSRAVLLTRVIQDAAYSYTSFPSLTTYPDPTLDPSKWPDSVARRFVGARIESETLSTSDSPIRNTAFPRAISQILTLSESIARFVAGARGISELLSASDTLSRALNVNRQTADTGNIEWPSPWVYPDPNRDPSFWLDETSRQIVVARFKAEILSTNEVLTRQTNLGRLVSNVLSTSDAVTRSSLLIRLITDNAHVHAPFPGPDTYPDTTFDPGTSPDVVVRSATFARHFTDSLTTSDSLIRSLIVNRNLPESLITSDAILRALLFTRAIRDAAYTYTSFPSLTTYPDPALDPSKWPDIITRVAMYPRQASESIPTSEVSSRSGTVIRVILESFSTLDAIHRVTNLARRISDAVTGSDVASSSAGHSSSITETITGIDSPSRRVGVARNITQTILTSVAATRTWSSVRRVSEFLTTTGTAIRQTNIFRTILNSQTTTDAPTREIASYRAITETLSLSAFVQRVLVLKRILSDLIIGSESPRRITAVGRRITEILSLTANSSRRVAIARRLSESLHVSDNVSRLIRFPRNIFEVIVTSDATSRITHWVKRVSETLSVSDLVRRSGQFFRVVIDHVTGWDINGFKVKYRAKKSPVTLTFLEDVLFKEDIAATVEVDGPTAITLEDHLLGHQALVSASHDVVDVVPLTEEELLVNRASGFTDVSPEVDDLVLLKPSGPLSVNAIKGRLTINRKAAPDPRSTHFDDISPLDLDDGTLALNFTDDVLVLDIESDQPIQVTRSDDLLLDLTADQPIELKG